MISSISIGVAAGKASLMDERRIAESWDGVRCVAVVDCVILVGWFLIRCVSFSAYPIFKSDRQFDNGTLPLLSSPCPFPSAAVSSLLYELPHLSLA